MIDRPRKPPHAKPSHGSSAGPKGPPRRDGKSPRPTRAVDEAPRQSRAADGGPRPARLAETPRGPRVTEAPPRPTRSAEAPAREAPRRPARDTERSEPTVPRIAGTGDPSLWIYGTHAVRAALANPARRLRRLLVAGDDADVWNALAPPGTVVAEVVDRGALDRALPPGATHQGVALKAEAIDPPTLEDLLTSLEGDGLQRATIMVLDQVTDPHNVGAILRSAAAFGAVAIVVTDRHAPPFTGTLAKAASGAVEHVPMVRVVNLARALRLLGDYGFHRVGLAGEATATLDQALARPSPLGPVALVLGAEGDGMRRLTTEACDVLARLPTQPSFDTLNVSNAAAIALYAVTAARARA